MEALRDIGLFSDGIAGNLPLAFTFVFQTARPIG